MGLFSGAGDFLSNVTGLGSGEKKNLLEGATVDPNAYADLYDQALSGLKGVNTQMGAADQGSQDAVRNALNSQLGSLANNAEGRKQNYLEDTSRSFASDTGNLARATGGTGGMANAMGGKNLGAMYDSQARNTSRGLNDLYSQATKDLGTLSGVQGNLYGENANQQNMQLGQQSALANLTQNELASRRGVMGANAATNFGANQTVANTQRDFANRMSNMMAPKTGQ